MWLGGVGIKSTAKCSDARRRQDAAAARIGGEAAQGGSGGLNRMRTMPVTEQLRGSQSRRWIRKVKASGIGKGE